MQGLKAAALAIALIAGSAMAPAIAGQKADAGASVQAARWAAIASQSEHFQKMRQADSETVAHPAQARTFMAMATKARADR